MCAEWLGGRLKFVFSPDIILCGWLGWKYQLSDKLSSAQLLVLKFCVVLRVEFDPFSVHVADWVCTGGWNAGIARRPSPLVSSDTGLSSWLCVWFKSRQLACCFVLLGKDDKGFYSVTKTDYGGAEISVFFHWGKSTHSHTGELFENCVKIGICRQTHFRLESWHDNVSDPWHDSVGDVCFGIPQLLEEQQLITMPPPPGMNTGGILESLCPSVCLSILLSFWVGAVLQVTFCLCTYLLHVYRTLLIIHNLTRRRDIYMHGTRRFLLYLYIAKQVDCTRLWWVLFCMIWWKKAMVWEMVQWLFLLWVVRDLDICNLTLSFTVWKTGALVCVLRMYVCDLTFSFHVRKTSVVGFRM